MSGEIVTKCEGNPLQTKVADLRKAVRDRYVDVPHAARVARDFNVYLKHEFLAFYPTAGPRKWDDAWQIPQVISLVTSDGYTMDDLPDGASLPSCFFGDAGVCLDERCASSNDPLLFTMRTES